MTFLIVLIAVRNDDMPSIAGYPERRYPGFGKGMTLIILKACECVTSKTIVMIDGFA
jgi:hypothetical protein